MHDLLHSTTSIAALWSMLLLLQLADLLSTAAVLRRGGVEHNLVMRVGIERLGLLPTFALAKALWLLPAAYIGLSPYTLIALCAFYAAVVAVNAGNWVVLRFGTQLVRKR